MASITQAPTALDLEGVAGDPFGQVVVVTMRDATGDQLPWTALSDPTARVVLNGTDTDFAPTLTSPADGQLQLAWSAEQTAAMGATRRAWALGATIEGVGPQSLLAGSVRFHPSTRGVDSTSTSAELTVEVGTHTVNLAVTLGAAGVQAVTAADETIVVGGTATEPTVKVAPDTFDAFGAAADEAERAQQAEAVNAAAITVEAERAQTAEAGLIPLTEKGAADGVATLDVSGQVPADQLPALTKAEVVATGLAAADVGADVAGAAAAEATRAEGVEATKFDTAGTGLTKAGTTVKRAPSTTGYANKAALPAASAANAGLFIRTNDGGVYESDGAAWQVVRDPSGTFVPGVAVLNGSALKGQTGIYVPSNWGRFWKPARAAALAGTGLARIAIPGDSITAGHWSSSVTTKSYVGLLAAALQAQYGDGGSGYFSINRSGAFDTGIGGLAGGYATPADYCAMTGTWSVYTGTSQYDGPAASTMFSANAAGGAQTVTFQVRGTTASVYYQKNTGNGSFSWTVDGVSQGTIDTSTSVGTAVASATGLSAGNHTIVVTVAAGQASVYLYGAYGANATGVVVNNFGRSGARSGYFDGQSPTFGVTPKWCGGTQFPADLVIYSLGVNDASGAVTAYNATAPIGTGAPGVSYFGNVYSFLNTIKNDTTGGTPTNGKTDLLILVHHIGKYDNATNPMYGAYTQVLRGLAESLGAAMVDMWSIYANSYAYAAASSYWGDDTNDGLAGTSLIHPGDAGHQIIANTLLPLLEAA